MKKEESVRDYLYLKKDLIKILVIMVILILVIVCFSLLDQQTGFISKLASKIMKVLIK